VEDNTVNGKPLVYLVDVSDYRVEDAGQVILINCRNITVENLDLSNTSIGIQLFGTEDSIIADNTVSSNNHDGINLRDSSNNTISGNDVSNNHDGINLQDSSNNTISGNDVSNNHGYGIFLYSSSNNTISGNTFVNDGLLVTSWSYHNTVENNTVNNKPLVYLEDTSDCKVEDAGQIILINCRNITVENLDLSNTDIGIELWETVDSIIADNTVSGNNRYGIYLFSSSNNTISGNDVSNNDDGIVLSKASNNTIYLNNFINNTENVHSWYSIQIEWNSTSKITYTYNGSEFENFLGNYWDDYTGSDANNDGIGDTPYNINSDNDNYPLMERFENYIVIPELNVIILEPPDGFCTFSGSELIVKAKVLDEEGVLYNATVTGKLSSFSFTLYDDGLSTHGDVVKDDGIYSAKITVPKIPNGVLKINARHGRKFGSASRSITIDPTPEQPLKVEAEIIDDNPPTFSGDTIKIRAVVSLNGVIVNDAEVKSTIIYPNSYQKNITLQNKGDYYEADFDWLFQGGEYTFDVVAYPKENAIPGYDTEKLNVYHGSLSITQEDTGTIFKKGEPVDFKVEVTCSGLTCPDKVNNAEVRMEILPDNEEIGLVGIGDGMYQAIYTFTSPGVRDITFSASAPFCIPAEINGNSIEIKEEDYELKKAVEDFADDNIETLETTKSSAADLSITGEYFFCKIEEEATERIASLIAKPLAFFTTDVLFPSMDFRTWYSEILGRSLEELSNTVLENVYYDYLLEYKQESSSPFLPHELRSYIELVNKFEDDITKIEEDTLSNFASIPEDQKPLFLQDLNNRQKANGRIKDLISKEVNFPYSVYKARLAEDTGWEKDFIEDIGVAIVGIIYPPAGLAVGLGKTVLDTCETVNNLEEDGRLVTITSETFSDMYVKSKKIKENTVSGISQFKHAIPPVMPEIEVLPIQDFYKGGYVHVSGAGTIWFETEKECYTLIEVRNTGTTQADIWVVAYFPNVIDGGRKSLNPGESGIFRIDYVNPYFEYKPEEGHLVTFLIFSERNDNSIYLVKEVWEIFSPIPVSEYASETSKECRLANSNNQKQSENLTIISYPIETTLARANMTTYEVIITARNPFAYPINANITQNTSTWHVCISSRETKTLNYTIHPELGVETTIPQAYMEYFDFQHNVTVTFASEAINFTPTGIEIKGDLPYEIDDCVEVNLSITNLVNITNGTVNLTLIGNETFGYNVTASIENVSTYTVKFGPIDVPEGDYIGISTFVWDDEKLTIDTRNMIKAEKQPPIANFTYLPLHPVVNQTVTFNASNSTDPDGNITKYDWDFGDGNITNTTEEIINHSYSLAGDYLVNLTVTDNDGATNSTSQLIIVTLKAPPEITSYAPELPVNDSEGATRTFNITINQTVNVSWQINGTEVQTNEKVTEASYTNTSAVVGTWNVSAIVNNANGTDMQTWVWTVEPSPCFIATAAYGTALHEDINVLRDFRDEYLMPNPAGRTFVKIYYSTSPPLAEVMRDNEGLRTAVRDGLVKPLVHITGMFVR
jgi:parallel beta-helix repeat protein